MDKEVEEGYEKELDEENYQEGGRRRGRWTAERR